MDFEELRAVWDAQENRTVFVVEPDAVYENARKRSRSLRLGADIEEFVMLLVCTVFPAMNGWYSGEHLYETFGALIYAGIAIFTLRFRFRRKRREREFPSTVVGELDRALYRADCQIWRMKNFLWWFLVPGGIYVLISMTRNFTWSGALATAIGYPACYLAVGFSRRLIERERRNLQALRTELASA